MVFLMFLFILYVYAGCVDNMVTFDETNSLIDSDDNMMLHFYFKTDDFDSIVVSAGQCSSDDPIGTWQTSNTNGCNHMQFTIAVNQAIEFCNFSKNMQSETISSIFTIMTIGYTAQLRHDFFSTTQTTQVQVQLNLETYITANSDLNGFGSVRVEYTLYDVAYDIDQNELTISLLTSVQWPYQLHMTHIDVNWNIISFANVGVYTLCNAYTSCTQQWQIVASASHYCIDEYSYLTLTENWLMLFDVDCNSQYNGACIGIDPNQQHISFSTYSDNVCKETIAYLGLHGYVNIYDDQHYTVEQYSFVFGARVYILYTVVARAALEHFHLSMLSVTANNVATIMYEDIYPNNLHTTSPNFHGFDTNTITQLRVTNNMATNNVNRMTIQIEFILSNTTIHTNIDASMQMSIDVTGFVTYKEYQHRRLLSLNIQENNMRHISTYHNFTVTSSATKTTVNFVLAVLFFLVK